MKATECRVCNEPHLLRVEDAGSDREVERLCLSCYGQGTSWLDAKLPFIDGLLMDISDDMPDGAWYQSRLDTIEWAMTSDDCSEVFEDNPDGVDEYDVMNWWIAKGRFKA